MKHSVPERMAQMMSEAAVSITITSVTDFFSFGIGILSPFPSVTIFCIYSGKNNFEYLSEKSSYVKSRDSDRLLNRHRFFFKKKVRHLD